MEFWVGRGAIDGYFGNGWMVILRTSYIGKTLQVISSNLFLDREKRQSCSLYVVTVRSKLLILFNHILV